MGIEFDIQRAIDGAKLTTRDGRNARIICFDRKSVDYPIVGLIDEIDNDEHIVYYTKKGFFLLSGEENDFDLFILETH